MSKLKRIAQEMQKNASVLGIDRYTLERGLHLVLRHNGTERALSLTRRGVEPSENECNICRAAFDVPENARRKTATERGYHIVRYVWVEQPEQLGLEMDVEQPVTAGGYE